MSKSKYSNRVEKHTAFFTNDPTNQILILRSDYRKIIFIFFSPPIHLRKLNSSSFNDKTPIKIYIFILYFREKFYIKYAFSVHSKIYFCIYIDVCVCVCVFLCVYV